MRAHDLASRLPVDGSHYKAVMAATKFDLGEGDRACALAKASSQSFFEIPSPLCLFEIHYDDQILWFLAQESDSLQGVVWESFVLYGNSLLQSTVSVLIYKNGDARICRFDPKSGSQELIPFEECDEEERKNCQSIMTTAALIEIFSCCNVATVEHQPPKFINAKRITKGKVPFFAYRTLHITGDTTEKTDPTGTHASPRLHLRRGHIRKLPDGRRIWVRATLVGDKSKGLISKDYVV